MGLMDTLKRIVGVSAMSSLPYSLQNQAQVVASRPVPTQSPVIHSIKPIPSSNALSLLPDMVPEDIFELLWFLDGPYKNYTPESKHREKINFHGFTLEISFMGSKEPSALSVTAPVIRPVNIEDIPRPQYYPAYLDITPQQRWVYLNWLKNIDEDINIGYVFIFYYGLERHLYFGQYEKAFRTILRLRKRHKNNSFLGYSSNALIACCLLHKREDLFYEYLNSIDPADPLEVSSLYLTAKKLLNIGLAPKEIISLSRYVGFANKKYIKEETVLFEIELKKLLNNYFGGETIMLVGFPLEECGLSFEYIAANFSLDQKQRCLNTPNLAYHPELKKILLGLLQQTHENVKATLKEMKKSGTHVSSTPFTSVHAKLKKPDEAFEKSLLFPAIDVHVFDVNEEHQQNGTCPNCGITLLKKPASKGQCIACGSVIVVKNSIFTGAKIYLTETQNEEMVSVRDERIRRNAVRNAIGIFGLNQEEVLAYMQGQQLSLEDAIIDLAQACGLKYRAKSALGLYRNVLLGIGELYDKLHKREDALRHFLAVCYYDLCGGENSEKRWNKKLAFLAPAVIEWIIRLGDDLQYKRSNMRKAFLEACAKYHEEDMPVSPEKAWPKLTKVLYETEEEKHGGNA
ncbi:MAG: TerB N-terminal domain-containing protein [Negativicutes bacterium]